MRPAEFHISTRIIRITLIGLFAVIVACAGPESSAPIPGTPESLSCLKCELVDVVDVIDANTLRTTIGDIQPYGTYVLDQPADCAEQSESRLRVLAGDHVRIEPGPADTVRQGKGHYYLFKENGDSIEQQLIREGLALTWSQDGQHLGWFLFNDAQARAQESGCLWYDYQAFQRGEPNDYRIPGLTYPDPGDR
jgi:endonuclease YncB( thermonuclease family)